MQNDSKEKKIDLSCYQMNHTHDSEVTNKKFATDILHVLKFALN